jgi:hypothetical protein
MQRIVALLTIGVALALVVSTTGGGVVPGSLVSPHDGGESDDALPTTGNYDDPVVDYDSIAYALTLNSTAEDDLNYSLLVLGAIEPVDDGAEGTVECDDQVCRVDGTLEIDEAATYHVSGAVVGVQPNEGLVAHVEGTLEGDALTGLGSGALSPAVESADDSPDGGADEADNGEETDSTDTDDEDSTDTDDGETDSTDTDDEDSSESDDDEDAPSESYLVAFVTTDDAERSNYEFSADGSVEAVTESPYASPSGNEIRATSNFDIDERDGEWTVEGHTANGYGDAYRVSGAVTDVSLANPDEMWIEVDGTPVTPAELQAVTAGELDLEDAEGPDGLPPDEQPAEDEQSDGDEQSDDDTDGDTGVDDGDDSDGDVATADDISITYENCHTVSIDVEGDRDASDWQIWEISTRFFAEDGVDTMILEPDEDLPTTIDANERVDGAVTDVEIEHVMLTDDGGSTFVEASQPDESCGKQINQQWEEYRNENDGDSEGDDVEAAEDGSADDGNQSSKEDLTMPASST